MLAIVAALLIPFTMTAAVGARAAPGPQPLAGVTADADRWSQQVWASAREANTRAFNDLVSRPPEADPAVAGAAMAYKDSVARREELRGRRIDEVGANLDTALAEEMTDSNISKALVVALELNMLSTDKQAALADPRVTGLIKTAESAARAAEARGDWLSASILYYRLYYLLDQKGRYEEDVQRLNRRIEILRLYAPRRLWELRAGQMRADGLAEDKLPPFNAQGVDYREKLRPVTMEMVVGAVHRASTQHVERTPWQKVMAGALRSVRLMAEMPDMRATFEGLRQDSARAEFIAAVGKAEKSAADSGASATIGEIWDTLQSVVRASDRTVKLPKEVIFHEFANGALDQLDEFSSVIWPDDLIRFEKTTTGKFVGVGVQIEMNEQQMVRVVTPLDGTPAYRAGIRTGDLIKAVEGRDIFGLSLDQVVELITGPENTPVTLLIERSVTDNPPVMIEKKLVRAVIPLKSIKGWKRLGAAEDDWEWFVDQDRRIGYVRVTAFTEQTTSDFLAAISQMMAKGMRGLVLDLRFNPGGLLDQAVSLTNCWVDRGVIVSTQGASRQVESQKFATPGKALLGNMPTIVLINEGAASASEIVSGALQKYGRDGLIRCHVVGTRSYGKGSVQDVYWLADGKAAMKLTTQYYMLPDRRIIHRLPGAESWGIEPDITVEMLPSQTTDMLILRRNSDVLALDEHGKRMIDEKAPTPDPDDLLAKGIDVQLQAALVLLNTQIPAPRLAEGVKNVKGTTN
ncbi:MAG: S41 family peptidase [Phycisphaeraceae bacterium]|nr:S41 family peptidase [Phycisphaerae bacterium]MBX3391048.1 S41 family peptidase [Phycisphaeraceae bacterium]